VTEELGAMCMESLMLSIEECKKHLNVNGNCYSDDDVKRIRDLMYQIGHLDYILFKKRQAANEKSNHLHKSQHGQAS
jgi:hypothetical protein